MMNIYLTNLGKYNEGELVGTWVSLPCDKETIEEALGTIGIGEEYEEYLITDTESEFDADIHEYQNVFELNEALQGLEDVDEDILEALAYHGYDITEWADIADDCRFYDGCYSMADIAENYATECGMINDSDPLHTYIDWDAMGRDMELEGCFVHTHNGIVEIIR